MSQERLNEFAKLSIELAGTTKIFQIGAQTGTETLIFHTNLNTRSILAVSGKILDFSQ